MRRTLIAGAAFSAALLSAPQPALADNGWGSTNCSQAPSPVCDVAAGTRPNRPADDNSHPINSTSNQSDSDGSGFGCRHIPVDYNPPTGQPEGSGGWYMVICSPDGKDPNSHGPVWIPAGATAQPTLSPEQVAEIARKRLRLPAPTIAASPSGTQLVHLPTWLWLSSGWTSAEETASVPGVSVTAVAKPASVTWSMGDGSTVTCTGPGTAFRAGTDPKSSSPDCGHVYRRSSTGQPGQAFAVSVTVQWTVTWSGAGQAGTFPGLTTTSSTSFRVAEAQALNTGR
jgi:hypothetical protein